MRIPLTEPITARYIYINPLKNKVHLMVPVVGGQEISTDNTCKATLALREFFEGGALRELTAYKKALTLDIELLEAGDTERAEKEKRLSQIEAYIEAVSAMRMSFGDAMNAFLAKPSNLYSIQLRPREQDSLSRVVNPVFNVDRTNDARGAPRSALYNAMHSKFSNTVVKVIEPRTQLKEAVLSVLPATACFEEIQQALSEQSVVRFGVEIDFTRGIDGTSVSKEILDTLMGFGTDTTTEEYIDALLGACARNFWETLPTPPFYSISSTRLIEEKTERLSILTQFFLANFNVYCKSRGLSDDNFGVILDGSANLSRDLVIMISAALTNGEDIERSVLLFFNLYKEKFHFSRLLNADDLTAIRDTFERTYRTVTATNENPHMDDFMILDKEATGETAKFVTHQGSICVNFAEIIDPIASSNPDYFDSIRADFAVHPVEVPHRNESVASEIEIETLVVRVNDEQFERLPIVAKLACLAHPIYQARHFLDNVAKGKQEEAELLLTTTAANTQHLLRTPGIFTDYSGRTFNCTAYEYAYWAKDTHMCRMLERHMDDETKVDMLARIDEMERIDVATGQPVGLVYSQAGEEHRSKQFDFTRLIQALQFYVVNYDLWKAANNWGAMEAAWINIGLAQRDVPAHVAHEYCRADRSFDPLPSFNEESLPRTLAFDNYSTSADRSWFPLSSSSSGLGFDFGVGQLLEGAGVAGVSSALKAVALIDLAAMRNLNEVRIADLAASRAILSRPASQLGLGH